MCQYFYRACYFCNSSRKYKRISSWIVSVLKILFSQWVQEVTKQLVMLSSMWMVYCLVNIIGNSIIVGFYLWEKSDSQKLGSVQHWIILSQSLKLYVWDSRGKLQRNWSISTETWIFFISRYISKQFFLMKYKIALNRTHC